MARLQRRRLYTTDANTGQAMSKARQRIRKYLDEWQSAHDLMLRQCLP